MDVHHIIQKYIINLILNDIINLINGIKQQYGILRGHMFHFYDDNENLINIDSINFPVIGIIDKIQCACCGNLETHFNFNSNTENNNGE